MAETTSYASGRRCLLLIAILLAEALGVSLHFEIGVATNNSTWLAWAAANAYEIPRIGVSFAGILLIVLAPRLKEYYAVMCCRTNPHGTAWLLAHLLGFGLFVFLTERLQELTVGSFHVSIGWYISWMVVTATLIAFWLMSLAPIQLWGALIKKEYVALSVAGLAAITVWAGGKLTEQISRPLAESTFWLTRNLLELILPTATSDAKEGLLGTPTFQVLIAPQCSGFEGISLITAFVAVYLWIFRNDLHFPRSFLLFPLGMLAIYVANIIRLAALVLVGTYVSPAAAANGFHSQAGWIAFNVIAIGIIAVVHRTRYFSAPYREPPVPSNHQLATALLLPFFAMMATAMLTKAFSAVFNVFYPLQVFVTAAAIWHFRKTYSKLNWEWSYQAVAIGIVVFFVWIWLEPAPGDLPNHVEVGLAETSYWIGATWILFRIIGTVITVPIAEELAFRGYLIRKLIARDFESIAMGKFTWISFLTSSILFGLLHSRFVAGTIAGMLFAASLYRRGRLADAVVSHITANALIAAYVLLGGKWELWT